MTRASKQSLQELKDLRFQGFLPMLSKMNVMSLRTLDEIMIHYGLFSKDELALAILKEA